MLFYEEYLLWPGQFLRLQALILEICESDPEIILISAILFAQDLDAIHLQIPCQTIIEAGIKVVDNISMRINFI